MTALIDSRRRLLGLGACAFAFAAAGSAWAADTVSRNNAIRAVAFDAFPIFNPERAFAIVRGLFPDHRDLPGLWFQKVFSDTWLRTSARRYVTFDEILAESLDHVAASVSAPLGGAARNEILTAFSALDLWPDVRDRLGQLKAAGLQLVVLSNMSEAMLRANMARNGVTEFFDAVLSTDAVQAFKPTPEAYAMAMHRLQLEKEEILFAPFAAWDAAGAAWFGYPTAWVNRGKQRAEPGAPDVRVGADLGVVVEAARG
ncbi:haloacid dehalogenase type II [Rhodoplanes sp. Z2-YC6860]|uniref:haloacid dehalogenase type II n=1 Tax=Rhodoplanes sp. Z2-YC6860 TaxID=674703 RepID=UPI00078D978E|nr:haloacid dehalogenase type II [Rhodoplanes sp. Z2-YC6860]AMN39691.1 Haloacetate dehalogenase H-2 [Rhodoplanes sp. Z2-YC6860]